MTRRAMLLVLTAVVLVSLSGCMGGGPGIDKAAIEAEIGLVIRDFETGIEEYDVDALLACLTDDFELTLAERGARYEPKSYATLEGELRADEENQLYWRDEYGYWLDLQLDERTFSNVTAAGATVTCSFWVTEGADGIEFPDVPTDEGTIQWHFVKVSGTWKITSMYINFTTDGKAAGVQVPQAVHDRGFGFGVGYPGLSK